MKKFIIAMDSFKGCLSSAEAGDSAVEAIKGSLPCAETTRLIMSDGGEGMAEAFTTALKGHFEKVFVHDLMMRRIETEYGVTPDGTAIIETAKSCGLTLVDKEERNPMRATTYGVGELIAAAVKRGCRKFIVGLGGSGTSDAGIGMLRALTDKLAPGGGTITDALKGELGRCSFTLACDVDAPLCGPKGAAAVFAMQKGATAEMIPMLEIRAKRFANMSARHFGHDKSNCPGAGAAGGLGYAFMQYLNADMRPGAHLMLDITGFDALVDASTCVITGEGHTDRQTLMGKLPYAVMKRAKRKGASVWLMAGRADDTDELKHAGFDVVRSIVPEGQTDEEAMKKDTARRNLSSAIKETVKAING